MKKKKVPINLHNNSDKMSSSTGDAELDRQLQVAEKIMRADRDVLKKLADS